MLMLIKQSRLSFLLINMVTYVLYICIAIQYICIVIWLHMYCILQTYEVKTFHSSVHLNIKKIYRVLGNYIAMLQKETFYSSCK